MTSYLISELAERSGVPVSTLRYYERIGLVEPSGRAGNNYREYDESILERLAFIARAKRLGMSLDDVATLTEVWFAGECEPLRERLRTFVTGRIAASRRQIAEERAFEGQLERILSRLNDPGPATRHCVPDCGCDTDPLEVTVDHGGAATAGCSLEAGARDQRIADWRQLLATARQTEPVDGRFRAVFDPEPGVISRLARLCEAEVACCPFFEFGLEIAAGSVALTIGGPADAQQMVAAVFAPPSGPPSAVPSGPPSAVPARPMSRIGG